MVKIPGGELAGVRRPGLHPWGPVGLSLKKQYGATTLWTHHLVDKRLGQMQTGQPQHRQHRLALGTWNNTSLGGKELVQEVERFQLDIVGLASTYSQVSGENEGWLRGVRL